MIMKQLVSPLTMESEYKITIRLFYMDNKITSLWEIVLALVYTQNLNPSLALLVREINSAYKPHTRLLQREVIFI